jgi:hypothetical protein
MIGQLLVTGGAVAGVTAGIVEGNVVSVAAVLMAVVLVRAAQGLGDAVYIICRAKPLEWMGLSDPQRRADPDDGERSTGS